VARIEKRKGRKGKTRFRVKISVAGLPMRSATFGKFSEAKIWAEREESDMRLGKNIPEAVAMQYTVKQMIERYILELQAAKKNKINYLKNKIAHLNWWNERIGNFKLNLLTHFKIADCEKQLLSGSPRKRGNATANRYLASLSHCLNLAKNKWGWIRENPVAKLEKYKEPRGRLRFLTQNEITDLLNACEQEKHKPLKLIVLLALCTACRKMELLSLKWKNIDLKRCVAVVEETKNNERRTLFLGKIAVKALQEYYPNRHHNSSFVFPNRFGTKPINIEREFRRSLRLAGISNFHFHDLRHTAASYLAMNGATHSEIAEVLGHKSLNMVKRYAHMSQSHTANVVNVMNDKMLQDSVVNHE
jgi:integrase